MYSSVPSLYTPHGQRKYLNGGERRRFHECTKLLSMDKKLFCQLIYFTGARIREVHNLTGLSIDFSNKSVVLETLKRRRKGVYREVPIPDYLIADLYVYINAMDDTSACLWTFSLRTSARYIKDVMNMAGITGQQSSAKGLRHGFAVYAISKAPITLVKKWLGHAKLETTEIYLNVIGVEEREIAKQLWDGSISQS